MQKRLDALFYLFLAIFAATAIVTLLGVVGIVPIRAEHLNWLLGAFLLELAGAVVALFRGAPFFDSKQDISQVVSNSVEIIDQLFPEIEAMNLGKAQADVNRQYGVVMRRDGRNLVAFRRVQVISGEDLENLPAEEKAIIKEREERMTSLRDRWRKLSDQRAKATTSEQRKKSDQELRELGKEMEIEFKAILTFLIQQGTVLEDHYRHVRDTLNQFANSASQE